MTIILSLLVLAAFVLAAGGVVMGQRDGWSLKPILMLVLAVVMLGNAAILSIPNERGVAPSNTDLDQ